MQRNLTKSIEKKFFIIIIKVDKGKNVRRLHFIMIINYHHDKNMVG